MWEALTGFLVMHCFLVVYHGAGYLNISSILHEGASRVSQSTRMSTYLCQREAVGMLLMIPDLTGVTLDTSLKTRLRRKLVGYP